MTTLIATSVVRGSRQGESHGGLYLIDLERERVRQVLDWNRTDIDWSGRGWDRGLRGIAFDGETVYVAASDELFAFDPAFRPLGSWRSPWLRHCHEIHAHQRRLYLSSTGHDAVLGFDLDARAFCWGLHLVFDGIDYRAQPFDPRSERGPASGNELHLNSVWCDGGGLYLGGLHLCALLRYDGRRIERVTSLPAGVHNARPFDGGLLYNDTHADLVRCIQPRRTWSFPVPRVEPEKLTHTDLDDSRIARAGFARGLCVIDADRIAAGSSPSTLSIYDLATGRRTTTVTLSHDIRNAIHGLEVWPFAV